MPEFNEFHFSHPEWLSLLIFPVFLWLALLLKKRMTLLTSTKNFADSTLLPYLILTQQQNTHSQRLIIWTLLWIILVISSAGPRWDYKQIQGFKSNAELVILLDLSHSMNTQDVRPNRFTRAKQEINDLLNLQLNMNIGLIGFASNAHIITPITEDRHAIAYLLKGLSPQLMQWRGSRLNHALSTADLLLSSSTNKSQKSILIITDGEFAEENYLEKITELTQKDIQISVLGIGTLEGAELPINKQHTVVSKLDQSTLKKLAQTGKGIYIQASYLDQDTQQWLNHHQQQHELSIKKQDKTFQVWEERYTIGIILCMILFILFFLPKKST